MYPVLFSSGSVVIPAWHVFYCIAGFAVFFIYGWAGRKWSPEIRPSFWRESWLIAYLLAYPGARLGAELSSAKDFSELAEGLSNLLLPGPMMFYGGFAGVVAALLLMVRLRRVSLASVADAATCAGFSGLMIGRIGCFLNGDDYGRIVRQQPSPFWALSFPSHPVPLPRVPVQLMESAFCLFLVLWLCLRFKESPSGGRALSGVMAYAVGRFFLEFLRGDDRGQFFFPFLSPSQGISLLLLLSGILILFVRKKTHQI